MKAKSPAVRYTCPRCARSLAVGPRLPVGMPGAVHGQYGERDHFCPHRMWCGVNACQECDAARQRERVGAARADAS